MDLACGGAAYLDRVVLLGQRAGIDQVLYRDVNAADEGHAGIHGNKLAVQAPEQVGTHADQPPAGREQTDNHARLHQPGKERGRQIGRAEAVDSQRHADAPARRRDQRVAQRLADLVIEQDEGLQQHALLRTCDGRQYPREVFLPVFE
ncbi:hypothetical protein D3C86_1244120 [compost metagenome]